MAGTYFIYANSRIADDSQNWQAACDTNISNWETTDKFVISITMMCDAHTCGAATLSLYWRDNDDASPTWTTLTTGELAQGSATDPGNAGCQIIFEAQFVQNDYQAAFAERGSDDYIDFRVAVDPASAQAGHEYQFIVYDEAESDFIDAASITITMAGGAVPSSHTYFKLPLYTESTKWYWNSGQFNVDSGMCALSKTSTNWRWFVVSSSSKYWYPSGGGNVGTKWIWVSGNFMGGGVG